MKSLLMNKSRLCFFMIGRGRILFIGKANGVFLQCEFRVELRKD